ncbi:hypothetical protein [Paenibacillus campi]|uniref:hypothetical protein n=1 Tax=Paenibacillus campi TaxID=3106031 RepID=UPI002AFDDC70|nr:hypothetical protein [Paenibacillus sp. SGZ-1014]
MTKPSHSLALPPLLQAALEKLADVLNPSAPQTNWLLGGSCSLLLQGIQLEQAPRDIDLYADSAAIPKLHNALAQSLHVLDRPQLNETRMYRSVLSHYETEACTVELVGDFEVRARESYYRVHVDKLLYPASVPVAVGGVSIRLMPLPHELIFNLLRDRSDRYEAISAHMRQQPHQHEALVQQLIDHNGFHPQLIQRILRLAGLEQG